jgi:hypothetical protein
LDLGFWGDLLPASQNPLSSLEAVLVLSSFVASAREMTFWLLRVVTIFFFWGAGAIVMYHCSKMKFLMDKINADTERTMVA